MNLIEEVKSIEVPGVRNLEWYYHSFSFSEDNFKDMLSEGIKCRKLLGLEPSGNNGHHYISLVKDLCISGENYGFDSFMKTSPSFIISEINPVKCSTFMFPLYHLLANTRISLRSSGWKDEFQEYLKIEYAKFVGLQCPLFNWIEDALDERYIGDFTKDLKNLRSIIEILREYGHNLSIYDYSRRDCEKVHLIDQDSYLDKCDDMIEEVTMLTKRRMEKPSAHAIKFIV